MPPWTHVYYWTLDVAVKSQPLWTTMQPILVAWETLLQQLAVEQGWLLHPIQTGFIRSPQVLKLFPAGELCVSITALEQAIEYCD